MTAITKGKLSEIYNIGNDKETRVIDLAQLVKKITESRSKIEFKVLPESDPKRRAADITKMRKLGWEPKTSLEEGIIKVVKIKVEEVK